MSESVSGVDDYITANFEELSEIENDNDEEDAMQNHRTKWLPLEKKVTSDGKDIVIFPFLADEHNMRVFFLMETLMVEEPFRVEYGDAAWNIVLNQLLDRVYRGKKVYEHYLTVKMIQNRFHKYMSFVAKYLNENDQLVGKYDEVTTNNINLLEDLFDRYLSAGSEHGQSNLSKRQEASNAIRNAALGKHKLRKSDKDNSVRNKRRSSVKHTISQLEEVGIKRMEQLSSRLDIQTMKADKKLESWKLQAKQLALLEKQMNETNSEEKSLIINL